MKIEWFDYMGAHQEMKLDSAGARWFLLETNSITIKTEEHDIVTINLPGVDVMLTPSGYYDWLGKKIEKP